MAFHNRVRLPINLFASQYGSTRLQYVKADGTIVTQSNKLKKTYNLKTDWMPDTWHQRLVIALSHDSVSIEGEKYFGGVALDANYLIDWDEQFRTPVAPAIVQVAVTPFDESNNNCMTCDEAAQLTLVDDILPDPVEENSDNNVDVTANDTICCFPVTFSITSFNTDYVDSATIDPSTGVVSFHVKTGLVAANGVKLVTYRATCFNGGYDEADIIGNVNGTIPGCLAPTNLRGTLTTNTSIRFDWDPPSPTPDHYHWQVLTNPGGVVLQEGDTTDTFIAIAALVANTSYFFQVASECSVTNGDDESNYIQEPFTTTPIAADTCGYYQVFPRIGGPNPGTITWVDCNGVHQSLNTNVLTPVNICALQSSSGVYYSITSTFTGMTITWLNDFQCGG